MSENAVPATEPTPEEFRELATSLEAQLRRVIVGQNELVRDTISALFAGGHVLLEGVPGLGKTVLVRTLGRALGMSVSRIQFTPDLMPADIVGTTVIQDDGGRRAFTYQAGPVFANLVLADEVNRATPKTQSALLEAMAEHQVTVGGETRALPNPFFVMATQNPIELEGTYPLPEAQLDRFLVKLLVPFPGAADLTEIVRRTTGSVVDDAEPVADDARLRAMMSLARSVPIADHVIDYAVRLVTATHPEQSDDPDIRRYVRYGASPRGVQALVLMGKVRALIDGRFNVAFDDIRAAGKPALRHRVLCGYEADAAGRTADTLLDRLLDSVVTETVAA